MKRPFVFCRLIVAKLPINKNKGLTVIQHIQIETTRKDLTHLSGLIFFYDLINRLNLKNRLTMILPQMQRKVSHFTKNKFFTGLLAFIAGAECIDDLGSLRNETLFYKMTNGGMAPSTMRHFLGIFKLKHFQKLQNFLPLIAYELRQKLPKNKNKIIITMDATPHQQYGQYMEGVEWDYKNRWCYSSQNAFDELGLCYGWNLMNGSAHSNKGAVEMIERIFKNIPSNQKRYFRADSAYGSHKIYNSLINLGVHFAICLKENVWSNILDSNEFKMKWTKTKIKFFESHKCHIASTVYSPNKLKGKNFLRVVFIRTKKKVLTNEDNRHYRYYAIVTDLPSKQMSDEAVICFYRGRSNAENFIKDLKYGMDFKHFPCQSMNKNKAWGFMGIFAYNLMRYASFLIDSKGCFLKRVRTKMVYLAAEIRKGQRKIKLRLSENIFREVKRLKEKLHSNFCSLDLYRASG